MILRNLGEMLQWPCEELGNSLEKGRNLPEEDRARVRKHACLSLPIPSITGIYHTLAAKVQHSFFKKKK